MVNYVLPWNPMRQVHRRGRIDRIGSTHDEGFLHGIFSDHLLDELPSLKEYLRYKIKQASARIATFAETRTESEKLHMEEAERCEREVPLTAYFPARSIILNCARPRVM